MTFEYAIAFAIGMLLWTALPGPGLAIVVSRSLVSGPKAGFAVVAGLVAADFIFLGVALVGLFALAATMGPMFQAVKYAGAAYLIWRGYRAIVGADRSMTVRAGAGGALWRDMALGLLATLGNPKAILFFGAILPAFVDMTAVGVVDFLVLAGIVAGVSYLFYGCCIVLADRTRHLMASAKAARRLEKVTGTILIGSGIAVAAR